MEKGIEYFGLESNNIEEQENAKVWSWEDSLPSNVKVLNLNEYISSSEEVIPEGFSPMRMFSLDSKEQVEGIAEIIERHKGEGMFEDLIVLDRNLKSTATLYSKPVQPSRY